MEKNMTTLYVSKKRQDGCVDSIEKALDMVAELRKNGEQQPITIKVKDEIYHVSEPIVIGSDVCSVVLEPENNTLISGGIEIKGFKKDTLHKNCKGLMMLNKITKSCL